MSQEKCLLDGEITTEEFLEQLDKMINDENIQKEGNTEQTTYQK